MKQFLYNLAVDRINNPLASLAKGMLWLLSCVYLFATKIIVFCYTKSILKQRKLEKPVISIGNITMGGSGKTPLVGTIIHYCKQNNCKPAILMRGYMASKQIARNKSSIKSDEAVMLKQSFPNVSVYVGKNRFASAKKALLENPIDVFLLDDGFQHWRLARDLDIVVIDAMCPFGNKHVLPRGILREPLNALSRANIFLITKSDFGKDNLDEINSQLSKNNPYALIAHAVYSPVALHDILRDGYVEDLSLLKGKAILGLCSIGNPKSFEKSLKHLGASVKKMYEFIDHYVYTSEDIKNICDFCRHNKIDTIVTTQKDAVKLQDYSDLFSDDVRVLSLEITLNITEGRDEFFKRLSGVLCS